MNRKTYKPFNETAGKSPLFVIGNGPSLRGFDFARLSGADTLGMNAAYRHWDKIDWRPTYYACLDDALIDTHKDEIKRLILENRIKAFFLSGHILEHFPDLATHENVHFLDMFVAHWHGVRGKQHGLPYLDVPAFRTASPNLLTTGAYAVRFGAFIGYRQIYLMGIDLDYLALESVDDLGDNRLKMTETPAHNPNYFFDDYQRSGDLFHVPNPAAHNGELHVAAFEAVRDDFQAEGLPVSLYNTNPTSRLNRDAILPYRTLQDALDEPCIGAVLIPLTEAEHEQLCDNLWLWSQPAFMPYLGAPPPERPDLVFICNTPKAKAIEKRVRRIFKETPKLSACFHTITFKSLDLSGAADIYQRENTGQASAEGWRAGPNNLFFGAMSAMDGHWGHSLYMETDCIPIRGDWLRSLDQELRGQDKPWVVGSIYRGRAPLGPRDMRHINGNALYATGDTSFQTFVSEVWRPQLTRLIADHPELPFDCLIEALYDDADSRRGQADELWRMLQTVAHKFQYSAAIHNMADDASSHADLGTHLIDHVAQSPTSVLVHSRLLASCVAQLSASGHRPTTQNLFGILQDKVSSAPLTDGNDNRQASSKRGLIQRVVRKLSR